MFFLSRPNILLSILCTFCAVTGSIVNFAWKRQCPKNHEADGYGDMLQCIVICSQREKVQVAQHIKEMSCRCLDLKEDMKAELKRSCIFFRERNQEQLQMSSEVVNEIRHNDPLIFVLNLDDSHSQINLYTKGTNSFVKVYNLSYKCFDAVVDVPSNQVFLGGSRISSSTLEWQQFTDIYTCKDKVRVVTNLGLCTRKKHIYFLEKISYFKSNVNVLLLENQTITRKITIMINKSFQVQFNGASSEFFYLNYNRDLKYYNFITQEHRTAHGEKFGSLSQIHVFFETKKILHGSPSMSELILLDLDTSKKTVFTFTYKWFGNIGYIDNDTLVFAHDDCLMMTRLTGEVTRSIKYTPAMLTGKSKPNNFKYHPIVVRLN